MTFFQNNLYKSLRIGLDDYMLNLTPFFRLNGLAKLSLNSLATKMQYLATKMQYFLTQ